MDIAALKSTDTSQVDPEELERLATDRFNEAADETPPACEEEAAAAVFSSPYLTNFSAKEFRFDNPEIDADANLEVYDSDSEVEKQDKLTRKEAALDEIEAARQEHKNNMPYAQAAARARCESCPLLEVCKVRTMAITNNRHDERYIYGIVGGVSEQERRNVIRAAEKGNTTVLDVWPEDFNDAPELQDPLRAAETKINKCIN